MRREAHGNTETTADIQHSAVSEVLDSGYNDIVTVESTWETIDSETRRLLHDDHLAETLDKLDAGISEEFLGSRDTRSFQRASNSFYRTLRKNITTVIAVSKWKAQVYVWGDEEVREHLDAMDPMEGMEDPYDIHLVGIGQSMTSLFIRAYDAERRVLEPFLDLVSDNSAEIEALAEFLTDEETPLDEYNGLLIALSRNHFDPNEESVIDAAFTALASDPGVYRGDFFESALATVRQEQDVTNAEFTATEQWLRMIGKFALAKSMRLEDFVSFAAEQPLEDLPSNAQAELAEAFQQHISEVKKTLLELITPFRLTHRFTLQSAPQNTEQIINKHKRAGGKRTTPRASGKESIKPTETVPPKHSIDTVAVAKQLGGESWHAAEPLSDPLEGGDKESIAAWASATTPAIMAQKMFSSYTAKHRNAGDVEKMVKTILEDPKGNGSHPMVDHKLSLTDARTHQAKRRHVYEFSPNDSTGIGLGESPESNRTRIYYCVSNGQLILLDIKHKTATERLRGRFQKA
jgi:hypothetical protein